MHCLCIPVNAFRGSYFDNQDFTGLKARRIDPAINFNWGTGSPDLTVLAESFTVRWEGYWDIPESGVYRFTATTDDGMRIWVDNASVLDAWVPQSPTTYTRNATLAAGRHFIEVDYFEQTGTAVAQVAWTFAAPLPSPIPTAAFTTQLKWVEPGP